MKLRGKSILLISPQKWDGQFVSKHHYARELAFKGNQVFFLGPPSKKGRVEIKPTNFENVFVISHSFWFSRKIRFHFRDLFDILVKFHVKSLIKKIGSIDLVWCFEPNLYKNLEWFGSETKIYHPVDYVEEKTQIQVGISADIIFSVAYNILDQFHDIETPSFFINHGLSNDFIQDCKVKQCAKISFAYIGNLMIRGLDRKSISEIILTHPEIEFDFYGSYPVHSDDSFIDFLNVQPNCHLKGIKTTAELAQLLKSYSGFLMCYIPEMELNNGSNSHKILEYLSFGKVIIANKVLHYEQHRDLIQMSTQSNNSDYIELFQETVLNINKYNSEELFEKRRALAYENTYSNQIDRIEKHLNEVLA